MMLTISNRLGGSEETGRRKSILFYCEDSGGTVASKEIKVLHKLRYELGGINIGGST